MRAVEALEQRSALRLDGLMFDMVCVAFRYCSYHIRWLWKALAARKHRVIRSIVQ